MTFLRSSTMALLTAGLFAALPSCAPPPEAIAAGAAVTTPAGQGGTIRVYRAFSAPVGTSARIYLGDAFLGYVSSRSQNTFHVKPGTYRLSVKFPPGLLLMPKRTKPFTIQKGQTLHFGVGFTGGAVSDIIPLNHENGMRANERYPSRGD